MNKNSKKISFRFLLFFVLTAVSLVWVFYTDGIQTRENILFANKAVFHGRNDCALNSSKKLLEDKVNHTSSYVSVSTNKIKVDIEEKSGDISNVYLKHYPIYVKDCSQSPKVGKTSFPILFSNDCKTNSVQSGIFGERTIFHLKNISRSRGFCHKVSVTLQGNSSGGLLIEKKYTFTPSKYLINSQMTCTNTNDACTSPLVYHEFYRSGSNRNIANDKYSYSGYSIYDMTNGYRRIPIRSIHGMGNIGGISKGWIADQEPGFLAAWITKDSTDKKFYLRHVEPLYVFGYTEKQTVIEPGKSITIKSDLYAGPTDYNDMFDARSNLENSCIRDSISSSSRITLNVIQEINKIVNNWPMSIALSTLIIRMLLYPLAEMGYITGFKMEKASKKVRRAQEKYKNNADALKAEIASIYKEENVNPVSGLVVALIQSPILLSLYSTIGGNIDFGKTSFLWMNDLSDIDPYFVMPFLVFLSMIAQHIVHDIYMDDSLEKSKQIPKYVISLVLGVSFLVLPAGLDVYWITTNVVSTLQQVWSFRKYNASRKTIKK